MHKRRIWTKLKDEITTEEVVVITGPRQVGKTTTLKWLLDQIESENKIYFDLENLLDRELFESKDYNAVVGELKRRGLTTDSQLYVVLDEIQLLDSLPGLVKYLYDHYKIKFFLSGSSSYYIKNRFSESMAGRKQVYEMRPLSFQEFLDFRGIEYLLTDDLFGDERFVASMFDKLSPFYQEYVEYGGLPRVVLTPDLDRKKKLLQEIFSSYIQIDVKSMADFKSTKDLRRVIKLLAARVGSKLNVSEIASIAGLSRVTVDNYIGFLEQTCLIRTVPAFSKSVDVRERLQKKPYFVDTGIANLNADLSSGSKFENTVCHQLSVWGKLSYYSDRDGEIDFIVDDGEQRGAFEVKETPTLNDLKAAERRAKKLGIDLVRVIGREPSARFKDFVWGGQIG